MSLAYRNMIALEAKSGRGLLRGGGRSAPNRSSILATGMRAWHSAGVAVQQGNVRRTGTRLARINSTVGKLERMSRTHPKKVNRIFATAALVGGGGGYTARRKAERRYGQANRKLAHQQQRLRHFGG